MRLEGRRGTPLERGGLAVAGDRPLVPERLVGTVAFVVVGGVKALDRSTQDKVLGRRRAEERDCSVGVQAGRDPLPSTLMGSDHTGRNNDQGKRDLRIKSEFNVQIHLENTSIL